MHRSPRARFAAASLAVVATLAFAACGGDDDDDTSDTAETLVDDTTATSSETVGTTDTTGGTDDTSGTTPAAGSGEVGERQDYVDAAAAQIPADDDETSNCIAEAMVSDAVYEAIQEQGVTVDDFSSNGPGGLGLGEDAAADVAPELAACGDLIDFLGANDDQRACIEDSLDNEQVAEVLALDLFGLDTSGDLATAEDEVDECINALSPATTTT